LTGTPNSASTASSCCPSLMPTAHPHVPVSADRIMANIDRVAEQIIAD